MLCELQQQVLIILRGLFFHKFSSFPYFLHKKKASSMPASLSFAHKGRDMPRVNSLLRSRETSCNLLFRGERASLIKFVTRKAFLVNKQKRLSQGKRIIIYSLLKMASSRENVLSKSHASMLHAFCACNYIRLPLSRQHKTSVFASRFTPLRHFSI